MTEPLLINRLTRAGEREAVATLAAAFVEYPLLVSLCPDAMQRPRITEMFCRYLFRTSLRYDSAFGTPDRAAIMLTWPPGSEWPSLWDDFRAGGLPFLWRMGWRRSRFILRLEHELDDARRQHVSGSHWYVPLLGVRPESQGKGLARTVMRAVFEAADRDRVPVYLETATEANVTIYKKLGFALRGHRELTCGLANWEMVREPRSDQSPSTRTASS
jgi:GNAT superfamily N-acetyltransferase